MWVSILNVAAVIIMLIGFLCMYGGGKNMKGSGDPDYILGAVLFSGGFVGLCITLS